MTVWTLLLVQDTHTWCAKNDPTCFLSELCQISTKFDNFWHTNSQDDKIM